MQPEGSLPHSQVPVACLYPGIVGQLRPVHTPTSHFLKLHLNIILPSTPGSFKLSLTYRFPHQNPVYASPFPHTCYMPRPSYSLYVESKGGRRGLLQAEATTTAHTISKAAHLNTKQFARAVTATKAMNQM